MTVSLDTARRTLANLANGSAVGSNLGQRRNAELVYAQAYEAWARSQTFPRVMLPRKRRRTL